MRRIGLAFAVVLVVLTITFVLSHLIPGDVIQAWLGKAASLYPNLAKATAEKYHLRDPIWIQYYYYLVNMAQGNLGISPSRGYLPVIQVIGETLPFTVQIVFFAFIFCVLMGITLGIVSARHYRSPLDKGIRVFYLVSYSFPPYFIGVVFLIVFTLYFHLLPISGAADPYLTMPTAITGIPMLDSLLEGNYAYFGSSLAHVILPAATLAITSFGLITRVARSSLLEVMETEFIRTARAKGLDEGTVFYEHALPNAAVSLITISSLLMTFLITGTVFVEDIFAYPGLGQFVVSALLGKDYPGIMASVLVFSSIVVATYIVSDILYAIVDPQIRLG
jgi:peptide/nickel transport system permease protein